MARWALLEVPLSSCKDQATFLLQSFKFTACSMHVVTFD